MIVISDISALEVWNALGTKDARPSRSRQPFGDTRPTASDELDFIHALRLRSPLHLLIAQQERRVPVDGIEHHVSTKTLPDRSLYDMDNGVLVESPELAFVRIARRLTRAQTQMLAMELCGSYSTLGTYESKGFIEREPVTSKSELRQFISRYYSEAYAKKHLSALRCIAEGSASPMESIAELLLCERPHYGGFGLPLPKMNKRIDISQPEQRWAGKTYYRCDLYWPEQKVAIEYDSNMFHSQVQQINRDAIRRNMLEHEGIRVITLTYNQLANSVAFEGITRQLSRAFRHPLRATGDFQQACLQFRKSLFSTMPWQNEFPEHRPRP